MLRTEYALIRVHDSMIVKTGTLHDCKVIAGMYGKGFVKLVSRQISEWEELKL